MSSRIAFAISTALVVGCFGAGSVFGQGGTGRSTTPPTTPAKKKPVTRTPTRRTNRTNQSSSESESQPTESQPSNSSTTYPNTTATPAPTPAAAESPPARPEPSLSQTLDWLGGTFIDSQNSIHWWVRDVINTNRSSLPPEVQSQRLDDFNGKAFRWYLANGSYLTNGCGLTFNYNLIGEDKYANATRLATVSATIPFETLNPDTVKVDGSLTLRFSTSGSKPRLLIKVSDTPLPGATSAFVQFNNENSNKAAIAIRHAIKLCGGKSDPF